MATANETHDQSLSLTATTRDYSKGAETSVQVRETSRSLKVSRDGRKVENGDASANDAIADVLAVARSRWLEDRDDHGLRAALLTVLLALEREK